MGWTFLRSKLERLRWRDAVLRRTGKTEMQMTSQRKGTNQARLGQIQNIQDNMPPYLPLSHMINAHIQRHMYVA